MVVATWLASYAPVGRPRDAASAAPSSSHTANAAVDIQREADRLHARLQQVAAYKLPTRNPFRFGTRPAPASGPRQAVKAVEEIPPPAAESQPPTFRIRLSGIGEDVDGDQVTRTAIISTPDDVHLVKVGETVADIYRVVSITADSVELVRLDDSSTVRLSLKF